MLLIPTSSACSVRMACTVQCSAMLGSHLGDEMDSEDGGGLPRHCRNPIMASTDVT